MIYAIVIVAILLLFIVEFHNTLVRKKNDVENAFASIDAMLKKGYEL